MECGDVSPLSYESFKSRLQHDEHQDNSPKVVNSTMMDTSATATPKRPERRRLIPIPLPYKCQECSKEYRKIENLRVHFMRHLTGGGGSENDKSSYICRHAGCNRHFTSKHERKNHEVRHVTVGASNCDRIQKMLCKHK